MEREREDELLLHGPHIRTEVRQILTLLSLPRLERVLFEQQLFQLVRRVKVGFLGLRSPIIINHTKGSVRK
jgi:hypothetical protein